MDGSQANIPSTSAIFAGALQVIEEKANKRGIQVFNPELAGTLSQSFLGKLQEQAERVAISRDGMRARCPLAKQTIGEKGL
jgi:hypothetical protein